MSHRWGVWCDNCFKAMLVFTIDRDGRESRDRCPICGTEYVARASVERVQERKEGEANGRESGSAVAVRDTL